MIYFEVKRFSNTSHPTWLWASVAHVYVKVRRVKGCTCGKTPQTCQNRSKPPVFMYSTHTCIYCKASLCCRPQWFSHKASSHRVIFIYQYDLRVPVCEGEVFCTAQSRTQKCDLKQDKRVVSPFTHSSIFAFSPLKLVCFLVVLVDHQEEVIKICNYNFGVDQINGLC